MDWAIVWASILSNWLPLLQVFVAPLQRSAYPALIYLLNIDIRTSSHLKQMQNFRGCLRFIGLE
jgi:hypothetical protein